MDEFELSYREVIPDQTNVQNRKDITINTGLYGFRLCLWCFNINFYVAIFRNCVSFLFD